MNIIEIKNLKKDYGKNRGIEDVTFDIKKGEIFGFIGPNGAGKSTTIRTILGFLKPTSGIAKVLGVDCTTNLSKAKMKIGYLPSEVNYYDSMKVISLLKYSAKYYKKNCDEKIEKLCDYFEVDRNKVFDELSFGNKKKVAIVQALLHEPELLILDEPTGGLDPLMQNKFFNLLKDENKKGTTIFFSSHILNEVQKMCDRVAIIKDGSIIKIDSIEEIRKKKYKKIKVELKNGDSLNELENMSNVEQLNRTIEFLYNGELEYLVKVLSRKSFSNLWIEEPSLEEGFMHYYRKEV
ncbi:MAG: ABC transporter ATP-binding protein [Clostridiales bacterium]